MSNKTAFDEIERVYAQILIDKDAKGIQLDETEKRVLNSSLQKHSDLSDLHLIECGVSSIIRERLNGNS